MSFRTLVTSLITRSFLIGWCLFAMGLSGALATWIFLKKEVSGHVINVPNLYGLNVAKAQVISDDLQLILNVDHQSIFSSVVEKDGVLFQVPKPGKRIKAGRRINVTLSAGPEKKRIPNVTGEPMSFAEILAKQAGTSIDQISRTRSENVAKGRIIAQSPSAGGELGIASGMSVLISDGEPSQWFVCPRLEGRPYAEAKRFLDVNGFRVVTKIKDEPTEPRHTVLRQNPQAGYPIFEGQTITLEINKD